jgi:YggT family protein
MEQAFATYGAFIAVVRVALFWIAVVVALIAGLDWLVRTRRVQPFSALARFCRRYIDPLLAPVERRVVRRGGLPSTAPWWALGVVVVGGLLLLALLEFLGRLFLQVAWGASSPGRFGMMLVSWAFTVLRIALIARVVSTWFQVSPWSKWIRWSYVLTEWMLAPLRRIVPTFGPVDITPLVAFILLMILQSILRIG